MAKRDSFLIRLSPATLDALRRWSDDEFRSVNSQIEMILQKALRDSGRLNQETQAVNPQVPMGQILILGAPSLKLPMERKVLKHICSPGLFFPCLFRFFL